MCALAIAQLHLGAVALLALVPWLASVSASRWPEALLLSAATGTVYGMLVAAWVPGALQALGSSPLSSIWGFIVIAIWVKGLPFAAIGLTAWIAAHRRPLIYVAVVAMAVAGVEYVAASAHLGVPWAPLGHTQIEVGGVPQLAVVGGVPMISGLVAGVNAGLAAVASGAGGARIVSSLVAAWASLAWLGLPVAEAVRPPPEGRALDLLVVQPNIPRRDRWELRSQLLSLQRIERVLERAVPDRAGGIAAILLPENLLTTPIDTDSDLAGALQSWVDRLGLPVITGLVMQASTRDEATYRSTIAWIEPGRGLTARIDKVRAVPVVESRAPLATSWLTSVFGGAATWKKVEEAPEAGALESGFTITPVLCYEALFPGLVASRRTADSVAIVNLADDAWVHGDQVTRELTAFARYRAIEQRLTLIRVAHGGLSVVADAFGRILDSLPLDRYATMRASVQPMPPPTFVERIALLALPTTTGFGVWWMGGSIGRYRS